MEKFGGGNKRGKNGKWGFKILIVVIDFFS